MYKFYMYKCDFKIMKIYYPKIKVLSKDIEKYFNSIINELFIILFEEKLNILDILPTEISKYIHYDINRQIKLFNNNFKLHKKTYYSLKPIEFKKFPTKYPKHIQNEIYKEVKIILQKNPIIHKKYNSLTELMKDYKKIKKLDLSKLYLNLIVKQQQNVLGVLDILDIIKLTTIVTYITSELIEVGLSSFENLDNVKENLENDEELKKILILSKQL